jgi:ketosteroid isomerase-like protein
MVIAADDLDKLSKDALDEPETSENVEPSRPGRPRRAHRRGETEEGRMESFDQAVDRYHAGLHEFVKGDPATVNRTFSQRDDVLLCNPMRPFARGPREVAETTERAASFFADGEIEFERVMEFVTAELGYMVEVERFRGTIDGNEGSGALRVTTIFRLEDDGWRVAHRHADPITTPRAIESILQT